MNTIFYKMFYLFHVSNNICDPLLKNSAFCSPKYETINSIICEMT